MVSAGLPRSLVVSLGLQWSLVVSAGPPWSPVVSPGLQWSRLVSSGLAWSPMVSAGLQSTTVELIPRSAYELAVIMPIYSNSTIWPVTHKSCKDLKFLCFTKFTVLPGY